MKDFGCLRNSSEIIPVQNDVADVVLNSVSISLKDNDGRYSKLYILNNEPDSRKENTKASLFIQIFKKTTKQDGAGICT